MNQWSKKMKEKLQDKNSEHKNIRGLLFELCKADGGYVLKPIGLTMLFAKWLKANHKSTMNAQQARNMAEVYSILCHMYYIAGETCKSKSSFAVAKTIWDKHCIKQSALENSIALLKETGLLDYYNHCYNGDPTQRKRFYKLNRRMLEFRIKEYLKKTKPESNELEELAFDGWGKFKGRKKKVLHTPQISTNPMCLAQNEPEPTDYDDLNDLLDDGWYFC